MRLSHAVTALVVMLTAMSASAATPNDPRDKMVPDGLSGGMWNGESWWSALTVCSTRYLIGNKRTPNPKFAELLRRFGDLAQSRLVADRRIDATDAAMLVMTKQTEELRNVNMLLSIGTDFDQSCSALAAGYAKRGPVPAPPPSRPPERR